MVFNTNSVSVWRPRQKDLLFSMWQKSLEVLNRFSKRNSEVSFHFSAPSPVSPTLRTVWVGQWKEAFT